MKLTNNLIENAVLPPEGCDLAETLLRVEDCLIDQALERTGQNKNQAAKLLSLNRTTLVEKLRKRGMIVPRNGGAA